jgi:hypothetical protein
MDENGSVALSVLVFIRIWAFIHPANPYHPAPPGSARRVRRKRKRGTHRENFPRGWWPRLVGEKGRSLSSLHRLPRDVKSCRRSIFASNSRARPSIYRGTTASGCIHHRRLLSLPSLVFSPQSSSSEQWRATATARRTTSSAGVPYTSGRCNFCTWRATWRRRTSARPEDGA